MCDSKELIVGYLYDDLSDSERRSFTAHMAICGDCREEVAALRATRGHLASWSPPEPDLGFQIIRAAAAPPARVLPMRSRWMPAFGLAAAAVIVLAAASAIANLEVRYDSQGLIVRTGWARGADYVAPAPAGQAAARPVTASTSTDFEQLDRRLRELEGALTQTPAAMQLASSPRMTDAEILRRVRDIVGEAESRQRTVVAERLLQVVKDFDRQRQSDLALIQQGLGAYQGLTNAEIAQQRDMLNQLYRVAARQEK